MSSEPKVLRPYECRNISFASVNAININSSQNFKLENLNFFNPFLALSYEKKIFITISKDLFYRNVYLFCKKIKNVA